MSRGGTEEITSTFRAREIRVTDEEEGGEEGDKETDTCGEIEEEEISSSEMERDEISMKSRVGGEYFKIVLNRGALAFSSEEPNAGRFGDFGASRFERSVIWQ